MKTMKTRKLIARPVQSVKKASTTKQEKLRIINELSGMWATKDASFFDLGKKS